MLLDRLQFDSVLMHGAFEKTAGMLAAIDTREQQQADFVDEANIEKAALM